MFVPCGKSCVLAAGGTFVSIESPVWPNILIRGCRSPLSSANRHGLGVWRTWECIANQRNKSYRGSSTCSFATHEKMQKGWKTHEKSTHPFPAFSRHTCNKWSGCFFLREKSRSLVQSSGLKKGSQVPSKLLTPKTFFFPVEALLLPLWRRCCTHACTALNTRKTSVTYFLHLFFSFFCQDKKKWDKWFSPASGKEPQACWQPNRTLHISDDFGPMCFPYSHQTHQSIYCAHIKSSCSQLDRKPQSQLMWVSLRNFETSLSILWRPEVSPLFSSKWRALAS